MDTRMVNIGRERINEITRYSMVPAAYLVVVVGVVFVAKGRKRSMVRKEKRKKRKKKNEAWSIIPSDRLEGQGMKINEWRRFKYLASAWVASIFSHAGSGEL